MLKQILIKLHFLIPLFVVTLPLLPKRILKHIFFIPILLPIIWLFCDGCPISNIDTKLIKSKSKNNYIHYHLSKIYADITPSQTNYIINIILMLSIILSTFKLM